MNDFIAGTRVRVVKTFSGGLAWPEMTGIVKNSTSWVCDQTKHYHSLQKKYYILEKIETNWDE